MDDLKENNIRTEDKKITRLPLTSDYVFKRIFAREENKSMLKDFLEGILNIKINNIEIKNPELIPNVKDEKLGILDIKLDVDDKKIIDVEMQVKDENNIRKRSSTYLAKLASEQLKVAEDYAKQKQIVTINILKFSALKRNSYHSIARMKYEKTKEQEYVDLGYKTEEENATDIFEMHFIELEKFKKKNPECNTKLEQWLWLIDGSREEKMKKAMEENKEVKKAAEVLEEISKDPKERERYEERQWEIIRYNSEMNTSRELGKKEGKVERNKEIAKKLKEMKLPINQIIEATGLNEEEIKRL